MKNIKGALVHLKTHQGFPATRAQLIEECNELSDFSAEDKAWFIKNLPEGTYNSASQVIRTLGL